MGILDFLLQGQDPKVALAQSAAADGNANNPAVTGFMGADASGVSPSPAAATPAPAAPVSGAPSSGGGFDLGSTIGRMMSGQGLFGASGADDKIDPNTGVPASVGRSAAMQSMMKMGLMLFAAGSRQTDNSRAAILAKLPELADTSDAVNKFAQTRLELAKVKLAERNQLVAENKMKALSDFVNADPSAPGGAPMPGISGGTGAGIGTAPTTGGVGMAGPTALHAPLVGKFGMGGGVGVAGPAPVASSAAPQAAPAGSGSDDSDEGTGKAPAASPGVPVADTNGSLPAPKASAGYSTTPPPPPKAPVYNPSRDEKRQMFAFVGPDKFGDHFQKQKDEYEGQEVAGPVYQLNGTNQLVSDIYKRGVKVRTSPIADLAQELGTPTVNPTTGKMGVPILKGGRVVDWKDMGDVQAETREVEEEGGSTRQEKVVKLPGGQERITGISRTRTDPTGDHAAAGEVDDFRSGGKELKKTYTETVQPAINTIDRLNKLDEAVKGGKVISGVAGETRKNVLNTMASLGLVDQADIDKLVTSNAITAEMGTAAGEYAKKYYGPQISNSDRETAQKMFSASLSDSPGVIRGTIDRLRQSYTDTIKNYDQSARDFNESFKDSKNIPDSLRRVHTAKTSGRDLDKEAADRTAAENKPPVEGAQKGTDGKWYVKKDGKTFRVDTE